MRGLLKIHELCKQLFILSLTVKKKEGEAYQKEQEFLTQKMISGLKGDTIKTDRNLQALLHKMLIFNQVFVRS